MVHIIWKKIRGQGPYAYLYRSFRDNDGRVKTQFVKYLGKIPPGTKIAHVKTKKKTRKYRRRKTQRRSDSARVIDSDRMTNNHGGLCFTGVSADTECLTINGWKKYQEICSEEKIATYNLESHVIEYQPVLDIKDYDFDGELIHIGHRVGRSIVNILMTCNHRNIVSKLTTKRENGEKRLYRKEVIVNADRLSSKDKIKLRADVKYPENKGIGMTLASLIGWIIAEGNYRKHGGIRLYQNKGEHEKEIDNLLKKLDIPYSKRIRKDGKRGVWAIKKLYGKPIRNLCPNKELNKLLVSLPKNEAKELFDSLIKGDGHQRKDGNGEGITFAQKSEQCMNWFSILALRLDYYCIISQRKNNGVYIASLTKRTHIGLKDKKRLISREKYSGKIWYPSVRNGAWVARRMGRVFITSAAVRPEENICST